jgi:hypothetical protein
MVDDCAGQGRPKVETSEDKEPTTTLGILSFYYHLKRSDKSININKINSMYRILLYSSTFMFYRTIYTAPMAIPTTQPQERYRHSRPAYENPLFMKSLSICRIESLFLLTSGTLLDYNPIPRFLFESIHFPRRYMLAKIGIFGSK